MPARLDVFPQGELVATSAHPGLLLDKFLTQRGPQWERQWETVAAQPFRDRAYPLAYDRWERFWSNGAETRVCLRGQVKGRLAVGLGGEAVAETGLRLHHTYGTPLIPASAIKGVLRHALRSRDDSEACRKRCDLLFGMSDCAGFAEFQDAWWVPTDTEESGLALDVLTVHHPKYYRGQAAPTDFDSPTPIHFLSVTGCFLFAADAPNRSWRDFLASLLKDVLQTEGIGAKRSAGYGRFSQFSSPSDR